MFAWVDGRDPILGDIFWRSMEATTMPRHEKLDDDFVVPGKPTEEVEGTHSWLKGPILKDKPQVNFPTLRKMYDALVEQENVRRESLGGLTKALAAWREYEEANPVPTYWPWWKPQSMIKVEPAGETSNG
jgi:hypothetical protein